MNSKNKGNSFERKIANLLSQTFSQHTGIEQSFRRNIDSGSFFGGANQKRVVTHNIEKASFGDIVCPNNFKFNIECKHYKMPPSFGSLVKQDNLTLDTWIKQGESDAKSAGKQMLLITKFNLVPEIAISRGFHKDTIIFYKGHSIVPLTIFLTQDISVFFD